MAQQVINVGTEANDGTGDTLRAAFQKVNANEGDLYSRIAANEGNVVANNELVTEMGLRVTAVESVNLTQLTVTTTDINLYVATTGSDSVNTGLTVGSPFLSIQKAVDVASRTWILAGAANLYINVADGTYNISGNTVVLKPVLSIGTGYSYIIGNVATPANVLVTGSGNIFGQIVMAVTAWHLRGMTLTTSGVGTNCIAVGNGRLYFQNLVFSAAPGGSCNHIFANRFGEVQATGNYSISGSAAHHLWVQERGLIQVNTSAVVVTITNNPAFTAFAHAEWGGIVISTGSAWTGSATGSRYSVSTAGMINSGTGANHFPGNSAGSAATNGLYV